MGKNKKKTKKNDRVFKIGSDVPLKISFFSLSAFNSFILI